MSLAIAMTTVVPGVIEISARGTIDADTAYQVRDAIVTTLTGGPLTEIRLDLRQVHFIDSVGISAMVAGFHTASVSGVKLRVVRPSEFVHRQLWITGLLGLFGAPEPHTAAVPQRRAPQPEVATG